MDKLKFINSSLNRIIQIVAITGSILMIVSMFLIVIEVIIRTPLIGLSMLFTYDLFRFLMSGFIICAMTYCTFHGGHVNITIVFDRLPEVVQKILYIIRLLLLLGVWVLVAWYSMDYAKSMWLLHEKTLVTKILVYPFRVFFAIVAIILCLANLPHFFPRGKERIESD